MSNLVNHAKKELDLIYSEEDLKEGIDNNTIQFQDVVKLFQYDDYEYDNRNCESCGDSVSWTTWNI